jgi:hypothetical protein
MDTEKCPFIGVDCEYIPLARKFDAQAKEIERLRTVAVKRGLWKEAPCCVCGYNGPNYFQPSVHKCAAIEENE